MGNRQIGDTLHCSFANLMNRLLQGEQLMLAHLNDFQKWVVEPVPNEELYRNAIIMHGRHTALWFASSSGSQTASDYPLPEE